MNASRLTIVHSASACVQRRFPWCCKSPRPAWRVTWRMLTLAACCAWMATAPSSDAFAQAGLVREGAEELLEALAKYSTRSAGKTAAAEMAEYGGKAAVRELAERAVREGGQEGLERVARLTAEYGPDAVRALDGAPTLRPLLSALDQLPADDVGRALARMAAGSEGRAVAELVEQFGSAALRAELKHPGLAAPVIKNLGQQGLDLLTTVGANEGLLLARHAPALGGLPASTSSQVFRMMREDSLRFFGFLARFAENNPGKILFTAATTSVLLANADRILGGDEIVFDADGNPHVVSKPGLVGRTVSTGVERIVRPVLWVVLAISGSLAGLWFAMTCWRHWPRRAPR